MDLVALVTSTWYEDMLHYSVSRIAAGVYERLPINGVDVA